MAVVNTTLRGTGSIAEVVEEVEGNARKLAALTGTTPREYRAAAATYDDVALRVVKALGYSAIGYAINGDGGASFSKAQILRAVLAAHPGDIVICHMNHPNGFTAEGIEQAISILRQRNYTFVRLRDVTLQE